MASAHPLYDRRPLLIAIAGPNGAGKSTFYAKHLAPAGLTFVNADVISVTLDVDPYTAAEMADSLRRKLVERRESFVFETVFSDPVGDKIAFLQQAQSIGYTVVLIFIGLRVSELSSDRVAMRVSQGGHDVPEDKLQARFSRILTNLKRALKTLPNVEVYDHSDLDAGYTLLLTRYEGAELKLHGMLPAWLRPLLPR